MRQRRVQTAEGELEIQVPQLRNTVEHFVSRVIPDTGTVIRTRPLEALTIGAYVRGLSDRDIESLLEEAGLGKVSKSEASRICRELRALPGVPGAQPAEHRLLVLFLDAIYPTHAAEWGQKACCWPGVTT